MKDCVEENQPGNVTDWKATVMNWMGLYEIYVENLVDSMHRKNIQSIEIHCTLGMDTVFDCQ